MIWSCAGCGTCTGRCPEGIDVGRVLDTLRAIAEKQPDVVAVLVEPVQGEGGFYPAPAEFLQALRKLCDEHGIVLIVDEIQSGFARTGTLFACEQADVTPDLMCLSKGLTGGVLPLAAAGVRPRWLPALLAGCEQGDSLERIQSRGELLVVSPDVDVRSRTLKLRGQLANADGRLQPGMRGRWP